MIPSQRLDVSDKNAAAYDTLGPPSDATETFVYISFVWFSNLCTLLCLDPISSSDGVSSRRRSQIIHGIL